MDRYTIIVQPSGGAPDHWLSSPKASSADAFAKWVHKATGAAVNVFDIKYDRSRLTLGDFDEERT